MSYLVYEDRHRPIHGVTRTFFESWIPAHHHHRQDRVDGTMISASSHITLSPGRKQDAFCPEILVHSFDERQPLPGSHPLPGCSRLGNRLSCGGRARWSRPLGRRQHYPLRYGRESLRAGRQELLVSDRFQARPGTHRNRPLDQRRHGHGLAHDHNPRVRKAGYRVP